MLKSRLGYIFSSLQFFQNLLIRCPINMVRNEQGFIPLPNHKHDGIPIPRYPLLLLGTHTPNSLEFVPEP